GEQEPRGGDAGGGGAAHDHGDGGGWGQQQRQLHDDLYGERHDAAERELSSGDERERGWDLSGGGAQCAGRGDGERQLQRGGADHGEPEPRGGGAGGGWGAHAHGGRGGGGVGGGGRGRGGAEREHKSGSWRTDVRVNDTTPPSVSCPAGTSASADGTCQGAVPNVLGGVTVSDNCSGAAQITVSQSPAAGTLVGLGPHTIT